MTNPFFLSFFLGTSAFSELPSRRKFVKETVCPRMIVAFFPHVCRRYLSTRGPGSHDISDGYLASHVPQASTSYNTRKTDRNSTRNSRLYFSLTVKIHKEIREDALEGVKDPLSAT